MTNKVANWGRMLAGMILLTCSTWAVAQDPDAVIMKDLQGAFHGLHEYTGQGKWTVVMLWASDCHVCNEEAAAYSAFHEQHKAQDATVLGISLDGDVGLAEAKKFVQRHAVTFPNLIDEPLDVANFFIQATGRPWIGTPTFMVYDPQGKLRGAQVGAVPTEIIEGFIARESAAN